MKSPVFILYVTLLGRALGLTIFGDWIEGKGDKSHGHGSSETSSMSAKAVDIYSKGLSRAQKHAHTDECKALIEEEYIEMLDRVANERPMPFEDKFFYSLDGVSRERNVESRLMQGFVCFLMWIGRHHEGRSLGSITRGASRTACRSALWSCPFVAQKCWSVTV